MSKSPEKMKAVKDRIFKAAMELFEEHGYENTSVADITQKAGVSKGTFFTHFPSKESVYSAVGGIFTEYIMEIAETGLKENRPVKQIFLDCIGVVDEWCEENRKIISQVMISDMHKTTMGSNTTNNRLAMAEMLITVFESAQQKAEISKDIYAADMASMLIGLFFTVMYDWINDNGTWSLKNKLVNYLEILFRGIDQ